MIGSQVVLGHIAEKKVAALQIDGKLHDVLIEDTTQLPIGTILRAVVERPVKGIGGVFSLDNGTGRRFLTKSEICVVEDEKN